jgi:heterodisulfide reductase subunit A
MEDYGIDDYSDVITSLQFERMLSQTGPTGGMPKRLSDGKTPKSIALIHYAGSEGEKQISHSSNLCCAYFAKQAILFKRRVPDGKVYALYTDLVKTKEVYETLIKRAREEPEVNYIRAEVSKIYEQNGKVKILYVDKTRFSENAKLEVDMAVLAPPMMASSSFKKFAEKMRIKTNEYGFPEHVSSKTTPPANSSIPGIFIAGCARAPMDIESTLASAETVAEKALELLSQRHG